MQCALGVFCVCTFAGRHIGVVWFCFTSACGVRRTLYSMGLSCWRRKSCKPAHCFTRLVQKPTAGFTSLGDSWLVA